MSYQIERYAPETREVFCHIPHAFHARILIKAYIEHPMQLVIHLPMASYCSGIRAALLQGKLVI